MSHNQLPADVQERINKDADKYAFVVPYDGSNKFYNDDKLAGYIAGATAYATKLHEVNEVNRVLVRSHKESDEQRKEAIGELKEAKKLLNEVFRKHESGLLPDRFIYEKIKRFCMESKELPHGLQLKIGLDASDYMEAAPFVSPHIAYAAGATEWAQWKVKYDELKAQQGAVWVKPKDVHKNGILHCCRMGGRTGYVYHSVVWDADGKRWIGGLSDETREIEVLDESGSNELVAENERLKGWKAEALTLLSLVDAYADKHPEIKLWQGKVEFTISRAKERDALKERCEKMATLLYMLQSVYSHEWSEGNQENVRQTLQQWQQWKEGKEVGNG